MAFEIEGYGPAVARILDAYGGGARLMPLVHGACNAPAELQSAVAGQLFTGSREPGAAMAGLYLYFSCWDQAHEAADAVQNQDGSYWHAIVHRQEPDAGNSAYWFRQASPHPIYPKLREEAEKCGYPAGKAWDPFAFIDFCESARRRPGSDEEMLAMRVQLAEWQLLFDHCAQRRNG